MDRVIVFDLGGTLMEYRGMPHSWITYYEACFRAVDAQYGLRLPPSYIQRSVEILREYNPRYKPREIEYAAPFLFAEATRHWDTEIPIDDIIRVFFRGMELTARIYPDTMPALSQLQQAGFRIAALTNLPSAMPDSLFRADIPQLLDALDLYVSSETCGYRKPHPAGLLYIAEHFGASISSLLFAGDEKLDIETSKRAGCASVLVCRSGGAPDFGQGQTVRTLCELTVSLICQT